jgi:hypothetical protein
LLIRAYDEVNLADLQTALADSDMHLFQNDVDPGPLTAIGDLDEADYTGYAAVNIVTWGAPFLDAEGLLAILSTVCIFRPTGTAITNVIYGWYLTETGGDLVSAGRFANAPLSMASALNVIEVIGRMRHQLVA